MRAPLVAVALGLLLWIGPAFLPWWPPHAAWWQVAGLTLLAVGVVWSVVATVRRRRT